MKPTARDRLLAAADELFYSEGIQTVGVDRIVQKAGVAKASLYNLFGSKEALVRAYLDARSDAARALLEENLAQFHTPRERLLGIFDAQARTFAEPDFNGSAHLRASAEAQPGSAIEGANDRYRRWLRTAFTDLTREAGVADPEGLAKQLQLLYDGAGVSARMDRDRLAAMSAQAAASALFDAAAPCPVACPVDAVETEMPERRLTI